MPPSNEIGSVFADARAPASERYKLLFGFNTSLYTSGSLTSGWVGMMNAHFRLLLYPCLTCVLTGPPGCPSCLAAARSSLPAAGYGL
jgi:hypothetical protein